MGIQRLANNQATYEIPPNIDSNYVIKLYDIQPEQTLYSNYLLGKVEKSELLEWINLFKFDTLSLSVSAINSSMGILIYRKENNRYYIFDYNNNKNFKDDRIFFFNNDSLKNYPKRFKAAINISPILEYFYKGKIYKIIQNLYFHPSKFVNITYTDSKEEELYIVVSNDKILKSKLPDGGYLYLLNPQRIKKFDNYSHFYVGTIDSVYIDKYFKLHDVFLSKDKYYRIDSVSPDLSNVFLTPVLSTAIGGDVGLSAPIMNYIDTKGHEFSTSKNMGKYILLDFMGSWCKPCIEAIPKLKGIYEKYKTKSNFDMASIAVEHEDNKVKFALFEQKHQIPWHLIYQPVTGKRLDSLTSVKFLVQGYPTYILLDTYGKIIFRNTGNEDLLQIRKILDSVLSNIPSQNDKARHDFIINGFVPGMSEGMVMLNYFVGDEWTEDSAGIRDEKFRFEGNISSPVRASVYFQRERDHRLSFYLESNDINIQLNVDSIEISKVSGSLSNIDFDSVKELMEPYYSSLVALRPLAQFASDHHLKKIEDKVDALYDLLPIAQRKIITKYALSHPDSYAVTERLFINFTNNQTELPLLNRLYNNFSESVKASDGGKSIEDLINRMERVQLGEQAPNFSLPNEEGQEVEFSSFKGKYILLDFWASWCVPCRTESPYLLKAYQKYKGNNFTIVSISLDIDEEQWLKAIEEDHFTWTQLSSLKGYQEKGVRQLYSVQGIPDNFLIAPDGKIIARGLRGEELGNILSEIL